MNLQPVHCTRSKMSTIVTQETNIDHRKHIVNVPTSPSVEKLYHHVRQKHQYARQKTLRNPRNSFTSISPQNRYPSSRLRKTTQRRDSTELRTTRHQKLLYHQNTPGASTKPVKVLSTVLPPGPKYSNSQSGQDHQPNKIKIKPSRSGCALSHFVLPDPCQPPADQDNTSIWEAVMAGKKRGRKPKAKQPSTVAPSAGSRGTSGFELFLTKLLGKELAYCPKYSCDGPDSHFSLGHQHPSVEKYVVLYDDEDATAFADAMHVFPESKPNESQLCNFITMRIFFAPPRLEPQILERHEMTFDQKAIVQKTEHNSSFHDYSISELRTGLADIRFVRLSPKERLEGLSSADTPNLLPAPTDLRGRCDMAIGINHMCLHYKVRNVGSYLPCYDPSTGVCCIWLRAEFKKADNENCVKAATHQWAVGAYLELQSRVRLARGDSSGPYLSESDPSSIKQLRHYGYIICGARVDIWEMCVEHSREYSDSMQDGKRRETGYYESCFVFPAQKLVTLSLDKAQDVAEFCQWHAKIMDWGFNEYSRQYLADVHHLQGLGLPPAKWALSYEDAIGKKIPSLSEEEQESCKF